MNLLPSLQREYRQMAPAHYHGGVYLEFVDGLRAIAVLAIVAFHINAYRMPGGFVGVDVFFVISGFLITGQIADRLDEGRFTLRDFYARRVRRLFPALMLCLVVTTAMAYIFLLPQELESFSDSIVAAAFYVSNIFFYSTSDYFDADAAFAPLLHTWSLAVEEQFYLIFPLAMMLACRYFWAYRLHMLVATCAVSLALAQITLSSDESAVFYLLPYRGWEFALGGIVALLPKRVPFKAWIKQALALGALLVVAGYCLLFHNSMSFPAIGAFPVVAATALLILLCREQKLMASWLLSVPALTFIGRISYSFYLWHWPVVVFYRLVVDVDGGAMDQAIQFGLSLGLGAMSYWWVERPTLRRVPLLWPRRVIAGGMVATAIVVITVMPVAVTGGLPQRFSEWQLYFASFYGAQANTDAKTGVCYLADDDSRLADYSTENCLRTSDDKIDVLLMGDSHAAHLLTALRRQFPDHNFAQANAAGCRPIVSAEGTARCTGLYDFIYGNHDLSRGFDAVVLSARWREGEVDRIPETLALLRQLVPDVYVLGPTMEYKLPLPRLLAYAADEQGQVPSLRDFMLYDEVASMDAAMQRATGSNAHYLSPFAILCSQGECRSRTDKGVPMSYDYGHYTNEGAALMARRLSDRGLLGGTS